ncbi:hypothetical protein [Pseudomonas asiatica]|uniref:hypothetical protein n=1 Tax=Pseudomonas asiatica TaxID=2219225 RepID=UPI0020169B65|nr:hypothetical protein [Pseudomonas asiatica]
MQPISRAKPPSISKESTLCEVFIKEFNQIKGWTCYPEAAGFDVLVVNDDGRQIGVQAKLSLNAKVAEQILPNQGDDFWESPGPDHRMVIVSKITDASAGIAKMLRRLESKYSAHMSHGQHKATCTRSDLIIGSFMQRAAQALMNVCSIGRPQCAAVFQPS